MNIQIKRNASDFLKLIWILEIIYAAQDVSIYFNSLLFIGNQILYNAIGIYNVTNSTINNLYFKTNATSFIFLTKN